MFSIVDNLTDSKLFVHKTNDNFTFDVFTRGCSRPFSFFLLTEIGDVAKIGSKFFFTQQQSIYMVDIDTSVAHCHLQHYFSFSI